MKIFDTLSGEKKELLQPKYLGLFSKPLNLFVCGPTVYDYPHVGNARTFVFFDIFTRYLRSRGFNIRYLQNITDIDDKIIQRSFDEKISWQEISKKYEDVYHKNLTALGVDTASMQFARATEHIPEIIAQVERLIEKKCAYKIDGDGWYFDLTTYSDYGQLARRTVAQAEDGVTRVDNSDKKKNAGDFCLWKFSRQGEPTWPAPTLGDGRPGWHIEDTAITEKVFGPQYDIHGGALDLKFPHHEAERAQQESASGKKPFVNFWMHAGFLTINGQKMSKSLGNFMTVDDLLKKMTADEFRMMLLMHHYRKPLDFSDDTVALAKKVRSNISKAVAHLKKIAQFTNTKDNDTTSSRIKSAQDDFHFSLDEDFNTPLALASINGLLSFEGYPISKAQANNIASFIEREFSVLGITLGIDHSSQPIPHDELPEKIQKLLKDRELSRVNKQFAQSDALRKEIEQLGYVVEDTPAGPLVLPK